MHNSKLCVVTPLTFSDIILEGARTLNPTSYSAVPISQWTFEGYVCHSSQESVLLVSMQLFLIPKLTSGVARNNSAVKTEIGSFGVRSDSSNRK